MTGWKSPGLAALALLGFAGPALAQETVTHVYVGGMFGQAHWRSPCSGQTTCDDTDRALRVFGGYQINNILSAEIAYNNLGKATGNTATVKGNAWEATGVAVWPLFSAVSVYGKLGIFRGNMEGSGALLPNKETNYGPTFGVGAQADLSRNFALRADWQSYPKLGGSTLPKTDVNVMSAGALWRFR
jgi:opacity protein-like surface antigen